MNKMASTIWWSHPTHFTTWTCLDPDTIDEYRDLCRDRLPFPVPPRLRRMNATPPIKSIQQLTEFISSFKYVEYTEIVPHGFLDRKYIIVWVNMVSVLDKPVQLVHSTDKFPLSTPEKRTRIVKDMISSWMPASLGMTYSATINDQVCKMDSKTLTSITIHIR
jgi:hypothetical protein